MAIVKNTDGAPAYRIGGVSYYTDAAIAGQNYSYTQNEIDVLNSDAIASSLIIRDQGDNTLQGFTSKYSGVISYGQSLAIIGGTPRISTTEVTDNLNFGVRPANTVTDSASFTQSGAAAFAALTSVNGAEVPVIAATNHLRRSMLNFWSLAADSNRLLVANAAGTGGRAIEQLAKGAAPEIYASVNDLVSKSITAAGGAANYGVPVIFFLQGEDNYTDAAYDNTEAGYRALLLDLYSDYVTDIRALATSQVRNPAMFITQASSWYDATDRITAIGNAQVSASITQSGIYMVGPYYAYPNAANHPTSDGYRYLGEQAGKVINKVLVRREGWLPCYAKSAVFRRDEVILTIHTPVPPLQVKQCYVGTTLTSLTNHGFSIIDDLGRVTINSITIHDSVIHFQLARSLHTSTTRIIQYASYDYFTGQGNICDSDATEALSNSTLTSLPYELNNWLCAFRMTITSDE